MMKSQLLISLLLAYQERKVTFLELVPPTLFPSVSVSKLIFLKLLVVYVTSYSGIHMSKHCL